jgi:hypothetical protein
MPQGTSDQALKAFLTKAIDDFQATERTDAQGDLPDDDVAETLDELAEELRR